VNVREDHYWLQAASPNRVVPRKGTPFVLVDEGVFYLDVRYAIRNTKQYLEEKRMILLMPCTSPHPASGEEVMVMDDADVNVARSIDHASLPRERMGDYE
jgi:hypothetical protein